MKNMKTFTSVVLGMAFVVNVFAAPPSRKGEISMDEARNIAMARVAGTITSSEYEHEMGQNVYSFDIAGSDGKTHEVLVSARSGKIISNTIESPAKEAAELKADRAKKTR